MPLKHCLTDELVVDCTHVILKLRRNGVIPLPMDTYERATGEEKQFTSQLANPYEIFEYSNYSMFVEPFFELDQVGIKFRAILAEGII